MKHSKAIDAALACGFKFYLTPTNTKEMHCNDAQAEAFYAAAQADWYKQSTAPQIITSCHDLCEQIRCHINRVESIEYNANLRSGAERDFSNFLLENAALILSMLEIVENVEP